MPSIEVVIGLLLIILFYSLLASVIMELISSFLSTRGKHLAGVLKSLLAPGGTSKEVLQKFEDSPIFKQLSGSFLGKKSPPSYISADTFQSILFKVLSDKGKGKALKDVIDALEDENLKEVLGQLLEEADFKIPDFKARIEKWYEDVMDRASGWYKRNVQRSLLVLGLVIAVVFNVDTLAVYHNLLKASAVDLENLVTLAEAVSEKEIYVEGTEETDGTTAGNTGARRYVNQDVYQLIETNLADVQDPLGIGWENVPPSSSPVYWLLKLFGWVITAICISKGAPFWFDILKKAVNFRATGEFRASTAAAVAASGNTITAPSSVKTQVQASEPLHKETDTSSSEEPVG